MEEIKKFIEVLEAHEIYQIRRSKKIVFKNINDIKLAAE